MTDSPEAELERKMKRYRSFDDGIYRALSHPIKSVKSFAEGDFCYRAGIIEGYITYAVGLSLIGAVVVKSLEQILR